MKNEIHEKRYGKFLISDDKHKLDLDYTKKLLCTPTATSPGLPAKRFDTVIENSLCFGVYNGSQQIGFGRVITDYSEFASIWDIHIDEPYRNKGIGTAFMDMVINDPKIKGVYRWFLMTENAHGLYEKFDFKREVFSPYYMMRINSDAD